MPFTGFLYRLREHGVPVSTTDALDFYKGLERGLAPDLETLFVFARLSFVRRVEQLDLDETIYQSAMNGGEIDLLFRRGLFDRIAPRTSSPTAAAPKRLKVH